ncbi:DNA-directed RNA polymerase I II [Gregarina niphandrodes]|uniref:DNA-directed RNA polymerase I II n=1 Tax=Gregarina niphandrodes TaxID=110365 RepID=A0A023BDP4_GRENI|nr:DNA-directed RNA polymerase I II [Gregarina niphandrodes]EZG88350.1 DNA-directed RNA polymerase I II [Gregarina niphandrodes]|eukprot:XP_011128577.1 DNA-directed RNA polymerase I II [Gregarina niphandrodes]
MADLGDDFDMGMEDDVFDDILQEEDGLELPEDTPDGEETEIVPAENALPSHRPGTKAATGPRQTSPYMTKFEKARVIGTRALQISLGAPVTVPIEGESDPLVLAEKELIAKTMPFMIRRYLPNGEYEDWTIEELLVD